MLWQQKPGGSLKCRCNCTWAQQFALTGDIPRVPASARRLATAFCAAARPKVWELPASVAACENCRVNSRHGITYASPVVP